MNLPLSAHSDKLLKPKIVAVEAILRKHKAAGEAIISQAPRVLHKRLPYLLYKAERLVEMEREKASYKGGTLPVGVREFIESPKYMNKKGTIWPKVIDEIEEACSGKYIEGVFTGGIGCAKSTAALYIQAYLLYLLSRMKNPHAEFGLDEASEIMIIFQSLNAGVAKEVEFNRFKEMIDGSEYFRKHFQYDKSLKTTLRFPNNIVVKPVSGADTAAIGQNVISAIIDEVNFMQVVEKSAKSADGGEWNQAMALYHSIVRRRESRFMQKGKVWGLLCLVSSARYPGQFTDTRKEASDRQIAEDIAEGGPGRTNIYIFDKRAWEVMDEDSPHYSYTGKMFNLFLGDPARKPRIMEKGETVHQDDEHLVMEVPIEHRHAFQDDIYAAIRDIAGRATLSTNPFMPFPEKIKASFGTVPAILSRQSCDFDKEILQIYPKRFRNPGLLRFAHCDLSKTEDSTGVAIGHIDRFEWITRPGGEREILPIISYDVLLEVKPPKDGEIEYAKIRGLLYKLRDLGLAIKWVSFDSYNSFDSIQILRTKGFVTGQFSLDTSPAGYEVLKQAISDGRVLAPEQDKCRYELVTLERDPVTGKIDHTEASSKDIADAMAGVAYGLTMRRELWVQAGIRPDQIPQSVTSAVKASKNAVEDQIAR